MNPRNEAHRNEARPNEVHRHEVPRGVARQNEVALRDDSRNSNAAAAEPPRSGAASHQCCEAASRNGARFCPECGENLQRDGRAPEEGASSPTQHSPCGSGFELVVKREGGHGRTVPLQDKVTIGKSDACDVSIKDDPYLSHVHARFEVTGDRIVMEDAGSANGSFVRTTGPTLLQPGDQLILGSTVIQVRSTGQGGGS